MTQPEHLSLADWAHAVFGQVGIDPEVDPISGLRILEPAADGFYARCCPWAMHTIHTHIVNGAYYRGGLLQITIPTRDTFIPVFQYMDWDGGHRFGWKFVYRPNLTEVLPDVPVIGCVHYPTWWPTALLDMWRQELIAAGELAVVQSAQGIRLDAIEWYQMNILGYGNRDCN